MTRVVLKRMGKAPLVCSGDVLVEAASTGPAHCTVRIYEAEADFFGHIMLTVGTAEPLSFATQTDDIQSLYDWLIRFNPADGIDVADLLARAVPDVDAMQQCAGAIAGRLNDARGAYQSALSGIIGPLKPEALAA
ncbi:MAG: hypothetical protein AAF862_02995 [Pseudomonadota bacterium]